MKPRGSRHTGQPYARFRISPDIHPLNSHLSSRYTACRCLVLHWLTITFRASLSDWICKELEPVPHLGKTCHVWLLAAKYCDYNFRVVTLYNSRMSIYNQDELSVSTTSSALATL